MELIEQIEARLDQAIQESNLDSPLLEKNLNLIQILTNLLAVLKNYEKKDAIPH
jgi:hypothetical protein